MTGCTLDTSDAQFFCVEFILISRIPVVKVDTFFVAHKYSALIPNNNKFEMFFGNDEICLKY